MADGPAFTARLTALGFQAPARNAFSAQGLITATDMCSLLKDDIDKMIQHLQTEVRNMPLDPNNPRPVFPFLAMKRLKAFYHWIEYTVARGHNLQPGQFNDATLQKWMAHMVELDRNKNDGKATLPEPLTSFDDWVEWEERLFTFCSNRRSDRTGVPFSYLLRAHTEVTDELRNAAYDSIDDDMIATMVLQGGDILHTAQTAGNVS
jgi:hypothetical protein